MPAGWTIAGGDPAASLALPRTRHWVDGFVIERQPVTNAEWIAFLDAVVDEGREGEALRFQPREPAVGDSGTAVWGRDAVGHFVLQPDAEGDAWPPDWPVALVS